MKGPKKKWLMVLLPIVVALLLLTLLTLLSAESIVELLWYQSLGYLKLHFLKIGYKYLVFAVVTLLFFLPIFLNFWVGSRYLGVRMSRKEEGQKGVIRAFRSGSLKIYTPLSLVLAIMLALPLYQEWEKALLLFFAPKTGVSDAMFHLDVSFYLFALPILNLLQSRLLITMVLMLFAVMVLYAVELKLFAREGRPMFKGARVHFAFLILITGLIQIGSYGIEALMLQYSENNLESYGFYGPGYAEVVWGLPLLAFPAVTVLLTTLSAAVLVVSGRGKKLVIPLFILSLVGHICRDLPALRDVVNKGLVAGQTITMQSTYLSRSVQSTLTGYRLHDIERRPFKEFSIETEGATLSEAVDWENIPLWDDELLGARFESLQAIRPYYTFSGVDAARYLIDEELHQVYLAARELDPVNIPVSSAAWVTRHLEYTHGYGFVMTPAAQRDEENMQWLVFNMPPESELDFDVEQVSIYYGMSDMAYAIAPNASGEFHYPSNEDQELIEVDYAGEGGVGVGTFWRKVLFGLYFDSWRFVLPSDIEANSRIHFRRNIQERIRELTPFLELDKNPYLVVTPERLYWMQDAYTTSEWYPSSQPYQDKLNYIRNSVKIVVDAYDGSVDYYLSDPTDPIARAYQKMYPGLIKPFSDMPDDLRSQVRYPKDLFGIQMGIYAKYHQTNPQTFLNNEDLLQLAELHSDETQIRMQPYYMTLDLIDPGHREFVLLTPLMAKSEEGTTVDRPDRPDNLRALAVVGSDGDHYGRMVFYTFPKGIQVLGPSAVNAMVDSNVEIAQAMTLWNQQGSEVKRGKMILLPVNGRILYIQPLYLESTSAVSIPQLKRVIVSTEGKVVMDLNLESAVSRLDEMLSVSE